MISHPSVIIGIVVLALLYGTAVWRARRPVAPRQAAAFCAGLATIVLALDGPIDRLADSRLFAAHMTQHLLLTLVMPPLLLMGTPAWMLRPLLVQSRIAPLARLLTRPLIAFLLYNCLIAVVHTPPIFERMVRDEQTHIAVHCLLMIVGVIMWWPLLSPLAELPRLSYPAQTLYLLLLLVPMAAVAAPITLAPDIIYPWYRDGSHPFGISPLDDQVLGGLLMWVGAGLYLMAVFSIIFFRWAANGDRDDAPVGYPARVLDGANTGR